MYTTNSVLDVMIKEPFICLNRIVNRSPNVSLNCVKYAKKEPIVELEDVGNNSFGLLSPGQDKQNLINDINEKQENHDSYERIMKLPSKHNESLSQKLKFTIDNDDVILKSRKVFSPLITADSNLRNAVISKTHVNLDKEETVDYNAAITNQNNNFDSLTLKKLCVKFKPTVQIVRVSQNLSTNFCLSAKSYKKKHCNLDHKKYKRCLFNTNECNADAYKQKSLTNYEYNGCKLKNLDTASCEKREISVEKYTKTHGAMISDCNTVHSNTQNDLKNVFPDISVECKQPIMDIIPSVDLKRLRTVPSKLENNLEDIFSYIDKICINDQKRVGVNEENMYYKMKYDEKESDRIKKIIDRSPTVLLKRVKINTTESERIKQEISEVNRAKAKGVLVSDSKTVHIKLQNDLRNRFPNVSAACKQPLVNKTPSPTLKRLRFDDETKKIDEGSKVVRNLNKMNFHLITPKPNEIIFRNQGRNKYYCKEVRIKIKRLKGEIIKKHLSMLSYPRNANKGGGMNVQKPSYSLQRRNSILESISPSRNSLMFSILHYSIGHTDILNNLKNKSYKKIKGSSISIKNKYPGKNGNGLNIAFKVFCTLQLSYRIHKVNELYTRF